VSNGRHAYKPNVISFFGSIENKEGKKKREKKQAIGRPDRARAWHGTDDRCQRPGRALRAGEQNHYVYYTIGIQRAIETDGVERKARGGPRGKGRYDQHILHSRAATRKRLRLDSLKKKNAF